MKNILTYCCKAHCVLTVFFFSCIPIAQSQCLPDFGKVSHFALFTITGAVGNTGISTIRGDIGTNTGAITGFAAPSAVDGTIYIENSHTTEAATDLVAAYNQLHAVQATNTTHAPAFGGGETLSPGVYATGGAASVAGNLTLDGMGDPNALFIFKIGGAFTTAAASHVILINGASPANIFWIADGAIAMAASTVMYGTLIANGAVSMGDQGTLYGRMYAITGAIAVYGTVADVTGTESLPVVGGSLSADQSICSGTSPADLVLSGSVGNVLKWESASEPSFAATTYINSSQSVLAGSSIGPLTATTYFRAIIQKVGCATTTAFSSTVKITIASTSWSGMDWTNGAPTTTTSAIIEANYTSSGNFAACTLTVSDGAVVTIRSGDTVSLNGALIVESGSSFKLSNDANLIQSSNVQNVGVITVERNTAALRRLDYVLWSSPVNAQILQAFSPLTMANRFYSYSPSSDAFVAVPLPQTTPFSKGLACLIRLPNTHPVTPLIWNGSFTGVPNNGMVNIAVANGQFNAVGNPYPSGIDADSFMSANNITQALYFWRKTNNADNSSYASYTLAGGISNSGGDPLHMAPGVIIPVGQGFIMKATAPIVSFTNAMRVKAVSVPFLKLNAEKSSIWLDMTSPDGFFGQQLVTYMSGATTGIDDAIDGRFFNDSHTALTSRIDNEDFSIQGRPLPFDTNDAVTLGFKSEIANTYTIAINHFTGLFEGAQDIFLKDNFTGIVTNLKTNAYTFSSDAGTFNSRFELVYEQPLKTQYFESDGFKVMNEQNQILINTGKTIMQTVEIYDVSGRLIAMKKKINASETIISVGSTKQILIVRIIADDNKVVSRKVG